jgi:CDP-glucose 4,6-dehydratase
MTDAAALAGRTVFVTGASGIVGSRLVRVLLDADVTVVALVRDEDPRSEFVRSGDDRRVVRVHGSLEDAGTVERALVDYEIDVLFHLGAQTQVRHAQRQPLETLEANVRGTYRVLESVRRLTRPLQALVIASSDKAYGESDVLPYVESHPLAGGNIYDASKSAADLLSSAYARSYDLPLGIARCANIYGPGDLNWDRIVPGTVRSLLRGERPSIRSDGTLKRDYLFVDDAVDAYLAIAVALVGDRECGEAFNFGNGEPVTVLELVDAVARAVGRNDLEPVIQSNAPNEIPAQWLDSGKARARLGWSPAFDLESGLTQAVAWYRAVLG